MLPGPPGGPSAHVFVCVAGAGRRATAARLLARARGALPRQAALHLLSRPLPKDALSGKVERKTLLEGITVEPEPTAEWPLLRARLRAQAPWLMAMVLVGLVNPTTWLCNPTTWFLAGEARHSFLTEVPQGTDC